MTNTLLVSPTQCLPTCPTHTSPHTPVHTTIPPPPHHPSHYHPFTTPPPDHHPYTLPPPPGLYSPPHTTTHPNPSHCSTYTHTHHLWWMPSFCFFFVFLRFGFFLFFFCARCYRRRFTRMPFSCLLSRAVRLHYVLLVWFFFSSFVPFVLASFTLLVMVVGCLARCVLNVLRTQPCTALHCTLPPATPLHLLFHYLRVLVRLPLRILL